MGAAGPQGQQGVVGPQGPQGLQGVPGKDCDNRCCDAAWLSIYSLMPQIIGSASSATFENVLSDSGHFDISLASTTGEIKCLKHGFYTINWGFDGLLGQPYPFPVPAWGLGIYVNNTLVPGTSSGAASISIDDICTHDSGTAIMEINMGDLLKLVNLSTGTLQAVSSPFGLIGPIAATRLNLALIKSLP
jgi:hypothetical protein